MLANAQLHGKAVMTTIVHGKFVSIKAGIAHNFARCHTASPPAGRLSLLPIKRFFNGLGCSRTETLLHHERLLLGRYRIRDLIVDRDGNVQIYNGAGSLQGELAKLGR